jgi:hypothetical protein
MAFQTAHLFIHQLCTMLTSNHQQAQNRVTMQLRDAFCAPNAGAFQ